MGMELEVAGANWDWQRIRKALDGFNPPGILRMIDGQLSFPEEVPESDWQEIRVGLPSGMVTLRRSPQGLKLVTWGNISPELVAQRDQLAALLQSPS